MHRIAPLFLRSAVGIALSAIGAWGLPAAADEVARQYSADLVIQAQGQTLQAKLYVADGKTRSEMQIPAIPGAPTGMGQIITIARADVRKVYTIFPDTQTYSEQPIKLEDLQLAGMSSPNAQMQEVGRELINGQPCIKYHLTHEGQSMWLWVTQDGHFPVRMVPVTGGMLTEFKNVHVGPQPASLFEVPSGYTQTAGMAGMLQGLLGGSDEGDVLPPELLESLRQLTNQ